MRRPVVVAVAVLLAFAAPSHAEDRAQAEAHFRLGEKAYQAQDFEAAAAQFEEAFKHAPLPEIAFSAAQAYRRLYRIKPRPADVARAVELYRVYLGKVTQGGRVADAADALAEMQQELDKLLREGVAISPELAKQHTRLSINVTFGSEASPTRMREIDEDRDAGPLHNARAFLDGEPVKLLSFVNVAPGRHAVRVIADGFFPEETSVVVPQGATQIADVRMQPQPAKVTIATTTGARVSVDGRLAGTTPVAPLELPAGKHVITIAMRGRLPIAREVVVARGQEVALRQPLQMTWRRKTVPWLLVGAGSATALFAVSTAFTYVRNGEARDLLATIRSDGDYVIADRERYERLRDARDNWRFTAVVSGGALVGLAGLAAVLYYTDNPSSDGVRVEPLRVPAGGGAAIAGRF